MVHLTGDWMTAYESDRFFAVVENSFTIKLSFRLVQEEVNTQKKAKDNILLISLHSLI